MAYLQNVTLAVGLFPTSHAASHTNCYLGYELNCRCSSEQQTAIVAVTVHIVWRSNTPSLQGWLPTLQIHTYSITVQQNWRNGRM